LRRSIHGQVFTEGVQVTGFHFFQRGQVGLAPPVLQYKGGYYSPNTAACLKREVVNQPEKQTGAEPITSPRRIYQAPGRHSRHVYFSVGCNDAAALLNAGQDNCLTFAF